MLLSNPVRGERIRVDIKNYPHHPDAVERPQGSKIPLVVHDFGPSTVEDEPPMDWPGGESNLFGTPIVAKQYPKFHMGIDISTGPCGPDVLAAAKGTVTVSHADSSHAQVVVIDHGTISGHHYETRYAHLQKPPAVTVGAEVDPGTVIGKLGNTGDLSTACHLHFAITKDGNPVDPWRRLAQNTSIDPDVAEAADMPIPASNAEYVAGHVAVVGNLTLGAIVRTGPRKAESVVRTIPAGTQETWLPTCFVKGEATFGSDRWLTRWNDGQWEFTHFANVRSVTPL
jgi:hypothetical protein